MTTAEARYSELAAEGSRDATIRLARLRLGQSQDAPALEGLDDWLTKYSGDVGVQMLRAEVLMRQTDKTAAVQQYEQLIDTGNPIVLNNLAWLYMERGDERAIVAAERAHDLAPNNSDIADTLGWILLKSGKASESLNYLRQSVQANPDNASVQYHLGMAYRDVGDRNAAEKALRDALGLGKFPEQEDAKKALAELSNP